MSKDYVTFQDLRRVGLTSRQIDYWTTAGILRVIEPLKPRADRDSVNPGIGRHRRWELGEDDVARRIMEYCAAGIALRVAEHAARNDGQLNRRLQVIRHDNRSGSTTSTGHAHRTDD